MGQEPMKVLGATLGVGLALLILVGFGYTFIRWYQRGWCWCREYGQYGPGMWGACLTFTDVTGEPHMQGGSGASWGHAEAGEGVHSDVLVQPAAPQAVLSCPFPRHCTDPWQSKGEFTAPWGYDTSPSRLPRA